MRPVYKAAHVIY